MAPPCSSLYSQTRFRNASRPTSSRLVPSAMRAFSTCSWVAIPAWSVPEILNIEMFCILCFCVLLVSRKKERKKEYKGVEKNEKEI